MPKTWHLVVALAAALLAVPSLSCGPTCKEVRSAFQAAKAAELAESDRPDTNSGDSADEKGSNDDTASDQPHFAVGARTRFFERRADALISEAIEQFVASARSLEVAGAKAIRVSATPTVREVDISRASDSCDHCFRLTGALEGSLDIEIPVLGSRSVPMEGTFDFVAPVDVRPGSESGGALVVDLGELARHEAAPIAISLADLRKSWRQTIEKILSSTLTDELADQLEPLPVVTFETPDFGIDGLDLRPTGVRISETGEQITALFSTSLSMRDEPGADRLAAAASPAEGRELGLAFPQRFVAAAVAFGFRAGSIPRRYGRDGTSDEEGTLHVAVEEFQLSPDDKSEDAADAALPFSFGFRAFHLPESGSCHWFDGSTSGTAEVSDTSAKVSVDGVEFTDASTSDFGLNAANWAAAQFLESGAAVAEASLDGENLGFPGGDISLDSLSLRAKDGFVTLSAARSGEE